MKNDLRKKENQFRITYVLIIVMLSVLSIWGAYTGVNYNFLDESNSVKIKTSDFSPDFSVHNLVNDDSKNQTYTYKFAKEKIENIDASEFKIVISKLNDNAIRVRLNGVLLISEGDFEYGRSMLKNSFTYGSFEKDLIFDDNIIEIETYSLYKSGVGSKDIIIASGSHAMKIIKLMDLQSSKLILLSLGFLFFSGIFTIYIYIASDEKDVTLIYVAIATFSLGVYFIDYIKIVDFSLDYFTIKKLLILSLNIGLLFYTLAIKASVEVKNEVIKILWSIIFLIIWYVFIMLYARNLIHFKTLYEYWYLGLLANILFFLIFFIRNTKDNSRMHIYLISLILLGTYTAFVFTIEFANGFFSFNSPLIYISVLATLPLLLGFDAIQDKERKIIMEQKEKEKVFLTSLEDTLTGAWNKRYFDIKMNKINSGDTLAMIDFDDFKKINDSYGHIAGDYILKSISRLIIKSIRKEDELCRIGGDEFVIIFSRCEEPDAIRVMEEIQNKISKENFNYDDKHIEPTISIGICHVEKKMSKNEILKKIDEMLYSAKHSGKNIIKS